MTKTKAPNYCGHPNVRCVDCGTSTGKWRDECDKCGSNDLQPSTCKNRVSEPGITCYKHGGTAPQIVAAKAERATEAKLTNLLARYGVEPVTDPLQELLNLAGEAVAWKSMMSDRVAELAAHEWRYSDHHGGEQLRAELTLFERSVDRCARILTDTARLDLDARIIAINTAIAEHQATTWATLVEAAIAEVIPAELRPILMRRAGQLVSAMVDNTDPPPPPDDVPVYVRADVLEAGVPSGTPDPDDERPTTPIIDTPDTPENDATASQRPSEPSDHVNAHVRGSP